MDRESQSEREREREIQTVIIEIDQIGVIKGDWFSGHCH